MRNPIHLEYRIQLGDEVRVIGPDPADPYASYAQWDFSRKDEVGIVIGFTQPKYYIGYGRGYHRPGLYVGLGVPYVKFKDGETSTFSASHLEFVSVNSEDRKAIDYRDREGWLEPLPILPFEIGDKVQTQSAARGPRSGTIQSINYDYIGESRDDGSPMPLYNVSFLGQGSSTFSEEELTLEARGNLWKHLNNQPLEFADLKEELAFARMLGKYEEIRNPETKIYSWTLEEALKAIEEGLGDCFSLGSVMGLAPRISVYKMHDRELGSRACQETLAGFRV